MDAPVLYKIMTEHSDREITGGDSWIGTMPPELYLDLGTGPALVAGAFAKFVKEICEVEAAKLDEVLHHVEAVVTKDPHVVAERGIMHHECADCCANVARVVATMETNPGIELIVANLFWAAPEPTLCPGRTPFR